MQLSPANGTEKRWKAGSVFTEVICSIKIKNVFSRDMLGVGAFGWGRGVFKKATVSAGLWLGMVRALNRHRMTFARVVFGPAVAGLVPREINYNADNSLRRVRGSFYNLTGNITATGTGQQSLHGKLILKEPVPLAITTHSWG